jgi:hypothetical protein
MNAQLQEVLDRAKKQVELKEIHFPYYSNDVYAKLFRNAVDIVKYYMKDSMYDFARISEFEKRREKDGVKSSGFVFTIFYRETGTHMSELSGKEEESSFLDSVLKAMGATHIVVVEKQVHFGNDNYSYEFYTIKK